ncbi:MAG: Gfo/Idh/MocA family oxidoreductase [Paucibacter sp.]|nr:Gfo/Idh/MocA family oxidoreductase [Roseateles sp.]
MDSFGWAVIAPGRIARRFAAAVTAVEGSRIVAVYGRKLDRAEAFAREHCTSFAPRATDDLDSVLADPHVDAVYIAPPHAQHGQFIRAALLAGKPVLCEKPLVPNRSEGEALVALSREKKVFLMEAVWTRFLPAYQVLGRWLREQAIGPLRSLQSSFCFPSGYDPTSRNFAPELAGGALLDIGIYNLTVTRFVLEQALGACPEPVAIQAAGLLAPTGVDMRVNGQIVFPGGLASQFVCAFDTSSDNAFVIQGERGRITLPYGFHGAVELRLERHGGTAEVVQAPYVLNGFEGQIEEAQARIRAGEIESPHISHAESLTVLGWMDEIRGQMGVRYPFE